MENENALKFTVVLPSLNPDEKLLSTIKGVLDLGFNDIILVNDGSSPEHLAPFEEAAKLEQVTLLTHEVNKGKGRALKTAMAYFLENRKDSPGIITMDGDGQHHPEDALACAREALKQNKVVLGVRDFSLDNVPPRSRMGNNITKTVFRIFCGIKISDTQTGLRVFPAYTVPYLVNYYGERYEYETDMLLEMKRDKLEFAEVTIRTIYIDENQTSHFHPFKDSIKIYKVIFKYFLRNVGSFVKYLFSSGICAIIDVLLFTLFNMLLISLAKGVGVDSQIMIATIGARIISSICNYLINRKAVFGSGNKTSILRYYLLAVCQMLVSGLLVAGVLKGISVLFNVTVTDGSLARTIVKIVVDTALFFVSYRIQKAWVFKKEQENE